MSARLPPKSFAVGRRGLGCSPGVVSALAPMHPARPQAFPLSTLRAWRRRHMLTEQREGLVAGIRGVEWDAVELPSQFMEVGGSGGREGA